MALPHALYSIRTWHRLHSTACCTQSIVSQANIEKIGKARTVVRQMKTLGKAKKLAKAEAKLAKLKAKEVRYTPDVLVLRFYIDSCNETGMYV